MQNLIDFSCSICLIFFFFLSHEGANFQFTDSIKINI